MEIFKFICKTCKDDITIFYDSENRTIFSEHCLHTYFFNNPVMMPQNKQIDYMNIMNGDKTLLIMKQIYQVITIKNGKNHYTKISQLYQL